MTRQNVLSRGSVRPSGSWPSSRYTTPVPSAWAPGEQGKGGQHAPDSALPRPEYTLGRKRQTCTLNNGVMPSALNTMLN